MIRVSVIMPCLNMKRYLPKCLESVLGQTMADIEVIVVDAGSEDGSLDIIKYYKNRDSRIRLIHADKRSYGYQVNLGISTAKGEYIGIVETDDYIEPDMYEVLYSKIFGTDAQYIKACADKFFEKNGWERRFDFSPCKELDFCESISLTPKDNPILFYSDNFIWNGIYKRDYISRFRLSETAGAAFQDIGLLFKIISQADWGIYIKYKAYNYRQDNGLSSSFSHNGLNFVRYEYNSLKHLLNNLNDEWEFIYYRKMAAHILGCFYIMACEDTFWIESMSSADWLVDQMRYAIDNHILKEDSFDMREEWDNLQVFLKDRYAFFEHCKKIFRPPAALVRKALMLFGNYDWIIFGCGQRGINLYELMRNFPIRIGGFCDNMLIKQGTIVQGIPVMSIDMCLSKYPEAHFLVPIKFNRQEIVSQLQSCGVSKERILLAYEELLKSFIYTDIFTLKIILCNS